MLPLSKIKDVTTIIIGLKQIYFPSILLGPLFALIIYQSNKKC